MDDTGSTSPNDGKIYHEVPGLWLTEPREFRAGSKNVSDSEWITVKQLQAMEARQANFNKKRKEYFERLLEDDNKEA